MRVKQVQLPARTMASSGSEPSLQGRGRAARFLGWLLIASILEQAAGCKLLHAPQTVVESVVPGKGTAPPDPLRLQVDLERFTDSFSMQMAQALDDYAQKTGTESARVEALKLKLLSGTAVISIASGPKPAANLLDMVAVASLGRMLAEDRWEKSGHAPAMEQWLATSRVLETTAWQIATNQLKPPFLKELRLSIDQWGRQNPDALGTFIARPQEFTSTVATKRKTQIDLNSVFSLVSLDPTSGLDPAVREITQTRLLAERAMFTVQRMPFLLRLQTELLAYQLTDQPQMRVALSNTTLLSASAERISRATESVSQTAAQLPDRISAERQAILSALDQQEGKLKDLGAQVDQALRSGEKMSTSLNTTIGTLDLLMKRFGVGEPSRGGPPDTNSRPFDILDYGQVAERIGAMAQQVNALVNSVNQSVPQLDQLSQRASGDAQKVVDHGFRLGLALIAALLFGAVLAGLLYRFAAGKLKHD